jgi:hypothetical protein
VKYANQKRKKKMKYKQNSWTRKPFRYTMFGTQDIDPATTRIRAHQEKSKEKKRNGQFKEEKEKKTLICGFSGRNPCIIV